MMMTARLGLRAASGVHGARLVAATSSKHSGTDDGRTGGRKEKERSESGAGSEECRRKRNEPSEQTRRARLAPRCRRASWRAKRARVRSVENGGEKKRGKARLARNGDGDGEARKEDEGARTTTVSGGGIRESFEGRARSARRFAKTGQFRRQQPWRVD